MTPTFFVLSNKMSVDFVRYLCLQARQYGKTGSLSKARVYFLVSLPLRHFDLGVERNSVGEGEEFISSWIVVMTFFKLNQRGTVDFLEYYLRAVPTENVCRNFI